MTPQRERVFRALFERANAGQGHPSAEEIFAEVRNDMPTISLRTVYQTLNDLVEMGELLQLDVGTGHTHFDTTIEHPHHHLVCDQCGEIRDVTESFNQISLPTAAQQGFALNRTEIIFRGSCSACAVADTAVGVG